MEERRKQIEEQNKQMGLRMSPSSVKRVCEAVELWETKGVPLKSSLGLTDEFIDQVYDFACRMGQVGQYEDAHAMFFLLTKLDNPNDIRYTTGLATASFMLGYYRESFDQFMLCYAIAPDNLTHLWYAIQANNELGEPFFTMGLIKMFLEKAQGKAGYAVDCERGKLMYAAIQERIISSALAAVEREREKV